MKLALAQIEILSGEVEKNLSKAKDFVRLAKTEFSDVVVFPEVFSTGMGISSPKVLDKAYKETTEFLENVSKELDIAICGTYVSPSKKEGLSRNLFSFYSPKGKVSEYSKAHLISYLGEDKRFEAGEELVDFEFKGFNIRPAICYDLRFPYVFSKGAEKLDLYIVPSLWPNQRKSHFRSLLIARAIENQAYVVGVNAVGFGKLTYEGESIVVAPDGEILINASAEEGLFFCDIEKEVVQDWRKKFPALKERRDIS